MFDTDLNSHEVLWQTINSLTAETNYIWNITKYYKIFGSKIITAEYAILRWFLYKLLKCIHDKTFLNFSHKLFCVFYHNVVKILQNTIWQSFDFRDRTKTFDYKALSICVFSFYCHCAAGSHKTLQTQCAMTLKRYLQKIC